MTDLQETPFSGVPAPLRANLERRGFSELTQIQQAVVRGDCSTRNLRLSSQTGSGKTIALGFAVYPALEDPSEQHVKVLVITPTRELANQVESELQWLFEGCPGARSLVVTGGTDVRAEQRRLKNRPTLVVGTPGRLLDHVRSKALDLSAVVEVVLDEADQMLDMGFKDELDALVAELPETRRSHLVSATFPDAVKRLARSFQPDPLQLEGTQLGQANVDIEHTAHLVFERDRYAALVNILLSNLGRRCLVFVQKRVDTAQVAAMLSEDGFSAMPLSGDLPQAQRNRTLQAFKSGTIEILVATDVAARGLHVDDIALVVHGDVPREAEIYTHRSGRTGRAGQKGQSLLLVPPAARRRTEVMLQQAKVTYQWASLPTPQKIRRALTKKARRALHDLLAQVAAVHSPQLSSGSIQDADATPTATNTPSPDGPVAGGPVAGGPVPASLPEGLPELDFDYAQRLLEHHSAEQVIAVLLALSQTPLPTEPRQVVEPVLHPERPPAWQTHRPNHSGNRNRPPVKRGVFKKSAGPREGHGSSAGATTGPRARKVSGARPDRPYRRDKI